MGESRLTALHARVGQNARFLHVLLFQAALPSEVPGYVLGTAGYPFGRYVVALGLVELPYAVGTVYLGATFVQRQAGNFILVSCGAVAITAALYYLFRRMKPSRGETGA